MLICTIEILNIIIINYHNTYHYHTNTIIIIIIIIITMNYCHYWPINFRKEESYLFYYISRDNELVAFVVLAGQKMYNIASMSLISYQYSSKHIAHRRENDFTLSALTMLALFRILAHAALSEKDKQLSHVADISLPQCRSSDTWRPSRAPAESDLRAEISGSIVLVQRSGKTWGVSVARTISSFRSIVSTMRSKHAQEVPRPVAPKWIPLPV